MSSGIIIPNITNISDLVKSEDPDILILVWDKSSNTLKGVKGVTGDVLEFGAGFLTPNGAVLNGVFFSNPVDALNTAVSGEKVTFMSGTYDINNLLRTGVDLDFSPDAKIIYTGTTGDPTKAIFDTSSLTGGYQGNITGLGVFEKTTDGSFKGIVFNNNIADDIYFEALSINSKGNTAIWSDNGNILVRVKQSIQSQGGTGIYSTGGKITVYADEIIETIASCVWSDASTSEITLYSNKLETTTGLTVLSANGGNLSVYGNNINKTSLNANSVLRVQDSNSILNVFAKKILGLSSAKIISVDNGILNLFHCEVENIDTTTSSAILNSGGILNVFLSIIKSNGTISTHINNGGTSKFQNTKINNLANNSSSGGLDIGGGTLILDNVTIVTTHTSSESLVASSAQNVKVYGTSVSNKAKNVNVTLKINSGVTGFIVDALVE